MIHHSDGEKLEVHIQPRTYGKRREWLGQLEDGGVRLVRFLRDSPGGKAVMIDQLGGAFRVVCVIDIGARELETLHFAAGQREREIGLRESEVAVLGGAYA